MLLKDLLKEKDRIKEIIERNKGIAVKVFGSIVRNEAKEDSDIDFLVEFKRDASLFDLIEIKLELEELLDNRVDVVSENGLKDNEVGNNIRKSAVSIWIEIKPI